MFQVFSGVYAVLNKKWKETHHDGLCEILADVERECDVEISYEKGAYQFQSTSLPALLNILNRLRIGSGGGSRHDALETSNNDAERHARQDEELFDGKGGRSYSAEMDGNSRSWTGEKDGRLDDALNTLAGRWNDGNQITEDKAAEQRAEDETEAHVEQADSLSVATSTGRVVNHQPIKSLHSASGALLSGHCGVSTRLVEAEAREVINCGTDDRRPLDRRQDNNALPTTGTSSSLPYVSHQATDNYEGLQKSASTNHSVVNVANEPDRSTEMSKDGQSGSETWHSSSSLNRSLEALNDLRAWSGSSSVPGSAPGRGIGQQAADTPSDVEHSGTEASGPSTCQPVQASAGLHNPAQRGAEMSDVVDKSSTVLASDKLVKNSSVEEIGPQVKIKGLVYARDATKSSTL